jgi:outer membrane protein assembly factor BamB
MIARLTLLTSLLLTSFTLAGDWPQFRGLDGAGVSDEKGLPTSWGPTENVKWKVDLPGRSAASPVVFGNKVFVTAATGPRLDRLHVICLDANTGKKLWHRQLTATGNTACHPKSSMAAPTPVVNADGVYCLFATADLAAFDLDGNLKWYRSLVGDYKDISNQVGMAASPVLWKDYLIVPMDTVGDSFLAAIDTKYGENVWKVDRPKDINWVTPTLRTTGDRTEIVFSSTKEAMAYSAADGKKTWTLTVPGASVPTAQNAGDRLLLPTGAGLACLKPDGTKMTEVWKQTKLASGYTTPLVYQDRVYAIGRAGTVVCCDLKNGKELWTERVGKGKGQFWASPIAADGMVFTFDDAGICSVLKAGDEPKVLAVNDMKAEILGTPAIAQGSLFIQTVNGIYRISAKK